MSGSSNHDDNKWQQKVLGIALVVEQVGKFSKLVFRYPLSPDAATNNAANQSNHPRGQPVHPTNETKMDHNNGSDDHGSKVHKEREDDNLFFTLPPKVMAKLFRAKPALCGQPMTLLIGGTIFCCRSVMLNQPQSQSQSSSATMDDNASLQSKQSKQSQATVTAQTSGNAPASLDRLVMFSIIVAVLPRNISAGQNVTTRTSSVGRGRGRGRGQNHEDADDKEFRSVNFPVIRRIHLSLARLCAVLEREERRCIYVSRQVSMLLKIGSMMKSEPIELNSLGDEDGNGAGNGTGTGAGTGAGASTNNKHAYPKEGFALSEADKLELMITAPPPEPIMVDIHNTTDEPTRRFLRRYAIPVYGNLASELAEIYHALARNDVVFRKSPLSLLTGRTKIVYINQHIAMNVQAARKRANSVNQFGPYMNLKDDLVASALVRPYHTLLFPHLSASELLYNIEKTTRTSSTSTTTFTNGNGNDNSHGSDSTIDGDSSQRKLEKVLLVCDPFKSLDAISVETALPLAVVIETAMSLIESGACIPVPVIHKKTTRFACQHGAMKRMASLRMEFAQRFSHMIPIFVVVSALTATVTLTHPDMDVATGTSTGIHMQSMNVHVTLGSVMRYCRKAFEIYHSNNADGSNEEKEDVHIPHEFRILTDRLVAFLSVGEDEDMDAPDNADIDIDMDKEMDMDMDMDRDVNSSRTISFQSVEDLLMSMTCWLRSHSVIVEVKDFFGAIKIYHNNTETSQMFQVANQTYSTSSGRERSRSNSMDLSSPAMENLYRECLFLKYLDGSVSASALAWRMDEPLGKIEAFREWGVRENKLQIVTRIPCDGDDWGAC